MPTTCSINFPGNLEKVFYSGQLLSGTVRLTLTSQKEVRGVYVEIYGKSYVHWTETEYEERDGKRESVTRSYTSEESFLRERKHFLGNSDGRVVLKPDTYNFNFQCLLPAQLPTSMEGDYGWIRYGARVVLDIPLWPDKEFDQPFTVVKTINLNVEPGMRVPHVCENVKTFMPCGFLCCWESGPLRMIAETPVGGYTPGQTINLKVNIENESNEKVYGVEASLVKRIDWYARLDGYGVQHHRETTNYLAGDSGNGCNINQNKEIRMNLRVPSVPPTDCSTSDIIVVKYYIDVVARVEGCCSGNLKVTFPITIGTYPIEDNIMTQPTAPQIQPTAPQVPLAPEVQPSAPKSYTNGFVKLPYSAQPNDPTAPPSYDMEKELANNPPTYEEATGHGEPADNNFKPKYPLFRRQTSYSIGD